MKLSKSLNGLVCSEGRALHADQGGEIAPLAVLAAAAFVCLFLLVLNTGWSTSEKIRLQGAADSTALSAGAWTARSLNVISMDNVTQTQLLALAIIVPAFDRTLEALQVEVGIQTGLAEAAAAVPVTAAVAAIALATLRTEETMLDGLQSVSGRIQPIASQPDGLLWQGMKTLGSINGAVVKTFGALAQAQALSRAKSNGAEAGFILQRGSAGFNVVPRIPASPGVFHDLCSPTRVGSPAPKSRGYAPLLGYEVGQGPLPRLGDALLEKTTVGWMINLAPGTVFEAMREREYQRVCSGGGHQGDDSSMPFPYLLGSEDQPPEEIRASLEFLAVTTQTRGSLMGVALFQSPFEKNRGTYAQARVFNPTSFDLFTQDWRVKLVPATLIEDDTARSVEAVALLLRNTETLEALQIGSSQTSLQGMLAFFNNH